VERDPVVTDPDLYRTMFENERVRVLEYRDQPGDRTTPHGHPSSIMLTLSSFRRRMVEADQAFEVQLEAGRAMWMDEQEHSGENIGETPTHVIFVELKEPPTVADEAIKPTPRSRMSDRP
jgi:hypothetical protein